MIRKRVLFTFAFSVLLAGHASGQRIAEISEGMSQQEVLDRFGHPSSARLAGGELRMYYPNRCREACADDVVLLRGDRVVAATLSSPLRRFQPRTVAAETDAAVSVPASSALAPDVGADAPSQTDGEKTASAGRTATSVQPNHAPDETAVPPPNDRRASSTRSTENVDSRPARAGPRRVAVNSSLTSVLDSNLYRREEAQPAQGMVAAAGIRVQDSASRPTLQLAYEVAQHEYRQTDDWDRVSHNVRGAVGHRVRSNLSVEAVGEAALKGTSEDRDLGNLFALSPRLEYRLTRANRIRLTGAYRLRQLEGESTLSETNHYLQLEFRQRLEIGQWHLSYRFEENDSENPRRDYTRWTFGTGHGTQLGDNDQIDLGIRYRAQTYPDRILSVNGRDVSRQDHRWIAALAWTHSVRYGFSTLLEYRYESRASNDPGREYDAHTATLGLRHDW